MESFVAEPSRLTGIVVGTLVFCAALRRLFKTNEADGAAAAAAARERADDHVVGGGATRPTKHPPGDDVDGDDDDRRKSKPLRDVFSVKQGPVPVGGGGGEEGRRRAPSSSTSTSTSSRRPFESSYYFAHNGHSTGGGYKDGLRAEDYVMNGPRLLSRGGVRVDGDDDGWRCRDDDDGDDAVGRRRTAAASSSSTPITRYMWDDDGGDVARIHIDALPAPSSSSSSSSSTDTIAWEDANVSKDDVEVRLIGGGDRGGDDGTAARRGLYVGIAVPGGGRYHLHVPRMYGDADSVRFVARRRKLLVRITKRRVPKRGGGRDDADGGPRDGFWGYVSGAMGALVGGGGGDDGYISSQWPRLSAAGTSDVVDDRQFKKMDVDVGGVDGDFGTGWGR